MLTTIVVSNKKPPLLSVSESGGSTSLQISKDTDETLDMEKGWCEAHDLVCDFLDELGYHEEANIFRDLIWYG